MSKLVALLLLGAVLVVYSKKDVPKMIKPKMKVLPRNAADADLAAGDDDAVKVDGCCKAELNKRGNALIFTHNVGGNCTFKIDNKKPGFLVYGIRQADDDLDITYTTKAAGTTELEVKKRMFSPYATGTFSMETSDPNAIPDKTVVFVRVARRGKKCHNMFMAKADQQRITSPGFDKKRMYKPNTFCEWWIQAEEGKRIQMDFNSFNMSSTKTATCAGGDYLAVAKTGDKTYTEETIRLCGPTLGDIPNTIQSVGNKLKVTAMGKDGGEGFCFKFKAID